MLWLVLANLLLRGSCMMLLLLGILHGAAPAAKLESNRLWCFDLRIDCGEV